MKKKLRTWVRFIAFLIDITFAVTFFLYDLSYVIFKIHFGILEKIIKLKSDHMAQCL